MTENESFLQEIQEGLSEILKPFQKQLDQQQKMAEFVNLCIRHASQDNFIELDELLDSSRAGVVENNGSLDGCKEIFDRLRAYADEKVERYRIRFIEDLSARAEQVGLPLQIDFPRLSSLRGIEGEVDFGKRVTTIDRKTLKSIDPKRIVSALLREKRELYDRPFDAQAFVDSLQQTWSAILDKENSPPGTPVPIQRFYFEYVMSLQSKAFFQDMAKGKFRGYSVEQFAVDIWRYFESGTGGTSDGYLMQLRPGRNNSLWLIDSEGEKRQITGISFQKVAP
ncbi:MAG: hypothetical protein P4L43_05225 [Syntrophobacteraceae bacterium]|nr:hypothetical protein [Syntrophobacteraceae bacterium]